MNTEASQTETIDEPAFLADPRVRIYLAGTDADLDRLVLDDGQLWAYSKRKPAMLCPRSLLDMVAVAFPKYAPGPEPKPMAEKPAMPMAEKPAMPTPAAPAVIKRPRATSPLTLPIPITGTPRGLLAGGKGDQRPLIEIDGERRRCPRPDIKDDTVSIAVVTEGKLVGRVLLPLDAYHLMKASPNKYDTMLFNIVDGAVTTRNRRDMAAITVQSVDTVLAALGSTARVTMAGSIGAHP